MVATTFQQVRPTKITHDGLVGKVKGQFKRAPMYTPQH